MAYAYWKAGKMPAELDGEYVALVTNARATGSPLAANYLKFTMEMQSNRRLLQYGLIGGAGLALLSAGAFGCALASPQRDTGATRN